MQRFGILFPTTEEVREFFTRSEVGYEPIIKRAWNPELGGMEANAIPGCLLFDREDARNRAMEELAAMYPSRKFYAFTITSVAVAGAAIAKVQSITEKGVLPV